MPTYIIILVIAVGIILLMVEFLVIPGVTIAGIAGTLFIVGGIFSSYYYHSAKTGNIVTLSTLVFLILVIVVAFKTKTWDRYGLKTAIESHATVDVSEQFKVGDKGKSVSRLAPMGTIMINDTILEARSLGGFIDPNTDVVIVRAEKNKIFVEPIKI